MRRLLPDPAELTTDDVVAAYRLPPGRWLRVNFIASLDGLTTVAGRSKGLQQPGDLVVFRVLRALADAVPWPTRTTSASARSTWKIRRSPGEPRPPLRPSTVTEPSSDATKLTRRCRPPGTR
jgi:hypothetical protein